jgi:hypothetical protein
MSRPLSPAEEISKFVSTASNEELATAMKEIQFGTLKGDFDPNSAGFCAALIKGEQAARQSESPLRTATRFVKRNKKEIGTVAAVAATIAGLNFFG